MNPDARPSETVVFFKTGKLRKEFRSYANFSECAAQRSGLDTMHKRKHFGIGNGAIRIQLN